MIKYKNGVLNLTMSSVRALGNWTPRSCFQLVVLGDTEIIPSPQAPEM